MAVFRRTRRAEGRNFLQHGKITNKNYFFNKEYTLACFLLLEKYRMAVQAFS